MTDAPRSLFSAVDIVQGDFIAFCASFSIFGHRIDAGALGIAQFYCEVYEGTFNRTSATPLFGFIGVVPVLQILKHLHDISLLAS